MVMRDMTLTVAGSWALVTAQMRLVPRISVAAKDFKSQRFFINRTSRAVTGLKE
jgi:hypothetical protein